MSSEVLKYHTRQRPNIQCVQLDQISRDFNLMILGLSNSVRQLDPSLVSRDMVSWWLLQHPAVL